MREKDAKEVETSFSKLESSSFLVGKFPKLVFAFQRTGEAQTAQWMHSNTVYIIETVFDRLRRTKYARHTLEYLHNVEDLGWCWDEDVKQTLRKFQSG